MALPGMLNAIAAAFFIFSYHRYIRYPKSKQKIENDISIIYAILGAIAIFCFSLPRQDLLLPPAIIDAVVVLVYVYFHYLHLKKQENKEEKELTRLLNCKKCHFSISREKIKNILPWIFYIFIPALLSGALMGILWNI